MYMYLCSTQYACLSMPEPCCEYVLETVGQLEYIVYEESAPLTQQIKVHVSQNPTLNLYWTQTNFVLALSNSTHHRNGTLPIGLHCQNYTHLFCQSYNMHSCLRMCILHVVCNDCYYCTSNLQNAYAIDV